MLQLIAIGEILFDQIDGKSILGGAPLNLALTAHQVLRQYHGSSIPVSRVGQDELGDTVFQELNARDICADYIQLDTARPTGTAVVTRTATDHSFTITEQVAWDYLTASQAMNDLASQASAICFGTLGQRSATSHAAIDHFLHKAYDAVKLFDVNLRQDFYSPEVLQKGLGHANILKLNEEELPTIQLALDIPADDSLQSSLQTLIERFDLDLVAYTRGKEGATLCSTEQFMSAPPPTLSNVGLSSNNLSDSVGAGDACAAGILTGTLLGWDLNRTLNAANLLGAFVASQAGATPIIPETILTSL
ncbi:MAG: PfkB family carbohydrate kinase [Pirellulaceae bacterium]